MKKPIPTTKESLLKENAKLREQLAEAEDVLRAIREGEVDAVIVTGSRGNQVFALSEAENLHRLMVEGMNEAGLAVTPGGLLVFCNDRACELFGMPKDQLLGSDLGQLVIPADADRFRRLLQAALVSTTDGRFEFLPASGSPLPMHLWASRLDRPDAPLICLVATDLSRVEADKSLIARLRDQKQALSDSRKAALNLMQDAIEARRKAEEARIVLAEEIAERRKAEEAAEKLARRNALMSQTAARLLSSVYPQSIVEDLCSQVMEFLSCDVFFNFLVDEAAGRLQLNACAGIPDEEAARIEWIDYGVAVCGCVARDRERIIVEDVQNTADPRTTTVKSYGIQAYCCHPLMIRDRLIGTLSFGTRSRDRFSAEDVALMREVADLTAIAIDRMRSEQALREAGEDLNRAQAVANTGSWRLNVRHNVLEWSEQNWRIFGVPQGTPLSYETFLSTVHPEDREATDRAWKAALGGDSYDLEHRIVVDGKIKWVRERAELEFDDKGDLVGGFGTTQDITERKEAEAKRDWLASFPQLNPSPVVELDPVTGQVAYINPVASRLFPELQARGLAHPFLAGLLDAVKTGESNHPASFLREVSLGEFVYAQAIAVIPEPARLRVYSMDITERKRMERALLEMERLKILDRSQRIWQNTFDGITDLISVHGRDGTIHMANQAFLETFGLTPETLHLKKCHELFHGGEQPFPLCPMVRTFEIRQPMSAEISDNGGGKTFDISTFPYLSPDGVIEGTIHIAKNITERKQTEMRLILSDRLAALGEMASGIAHEFNNPLATISGCAEGLQDRFRSGAIDPELLRDYLAIIREEVARCKDITSNMLSFVRKGSGQKRVLELTGTIDRTLELIGFQGRLQNVEISREFHAGPLPVLASEGEIKQVLIVLISNALDAVEDRGRIQLATGAENSNAWVRIRDSGPGIRSENIGRIFDPFFSTKAQGTGLGLSIARKIVESLNGTLTLQETGERGTTFVISLPLAEEPGAEDLRPGSLPDAPNPGISAG